MNETFDGWRRARCALFFASLFAVTVDTASAQAPAPTVVDPNLAVRTVVSGLNQPTTMAFIGANDIFVLEKASGKVQRVVSGAIQSIVLDLAVNSASERGLLGIALHPNFPANPGVYLYWTESSTGADSTNLADVALLGNRVDRFVWNGSTLAFERNLIMLHAFQADGAPTPPDQGDSAQGPAGNHNGSTSPRRLALRSSTPSMSLTNHR